KWNLRRLQLATRLVELKPLDAVDLGEALDPPRPGRPLHLVGIADRGRGVQVALGRPRQDQLARLLADLTQRDERGVGELVAGLLRELAASDRNQLLALLHLAFGDRPLPQVLVPPLGAALVGEQHLQAILAAAPQQDAGAGTPGLVGRHRQPPRPAWVRMAAARTRPEGHGTSSRGRLLGSAPGCGPSHASSASTSLAW